MKYLNEGISRKRESFRKIFWLERIFTSHRGGQLSNQESAALCDDCCENLFDALFWYLRWRFYQLNHHILSASNTISNLILKHFPSGELIAYHCPICVCDPFLHCRIEVIDNLRLRWFKSVVVLSVGWVYRDGVLFWYSTTKRWTWTLRLSFDGAGTYICTK